MSKEAAGRYTGRYQHWDMLELGYKANLSDIKAALLLGQLPRLEAQLRAARGDRAPLRSRRSRTCPGISFPVVRPGATSARHLFTIWVPPQHGATNALAQLQDKGIGVAVNYRAVHLLSYYRSAVRLPARAFP